ncbi:MAG: methionine gamma-lyase family protein [Defluviitaleaceae bacterium]|nr:methionine gamma-lyase family protein [Defluviitaleaceae bacterium]
MNSDFQALLRSTYGIDDRLLELAAECEAELVPIFAEIDDISQYNQLKVLSAMQANRLSDIHFAATTGYGYNDLGREALESIYADVFGCESALVRPQMVSGTHALSTALFGNLRHGDELVSPVGTPYNTLQKVIGIQEARGSLIEHGIVYKQVDLLPDDKIDFHAVKAAITPRTKMMTIQRSKGYAWRHSLSVSEIGELIAFIKGIRKDIICMVDNCYGEFVERLEPSNVGADMVVGSLIKNPGGGLAPVGGYITGTEECVENSAVRLTSPGLGKEVGPTLGVISQLTQGLFLAPAVVGSSLRTAVFSAKLLDRLGIETLPKFDAVRSDIVQAIKFGTPEKVIAYCQGIQQAAAVDSFAAPEASDMPGYDSQVIMAAGAFVQGASIELSADSPMKPPYIVYQQGALTWQHGKIGAILAIHNLSKKGLL